MMQNSVPSIIILGGAQIGIEKITWAKECGLHVIVVDRDIESPGIKIADTPVVADRNDQVDLIAQLVVATQGMDIRAVYCGIDLGVTPTVIANALNVPSISIKSAVMSQHKWLMKTKWLESGIATPIGVLCNNKQMLLDFVDEHGFPIIVKVLNSSGSRGVLKIFSESEIDSALASISEFSTTDSYLVEQCIQGNMHDVNGFFWDNKFYPCGIMDRYFHSGSECVSAYTIDPSDIGNKEKNQIYHLLEESSRALGITCGPVKGDLVWGPNGPLMIEISPRFHGDIQTINTSPLGPGVNPFKSYCSALVSGKVDNQFLENNNQMYSGWKTIPCNKGIFLGINGMDKVLELPGIERIYVYRKKGQKIDAMSDNTQIAGVVVATAESRDNLNNIFEKAFNILECRVE